MNKVEQIPSRRIDQDELAILHTPTFLREFRKVTTPEEREIIYESQLLDDVLKGRKAANERALAVIMNQVVAYHSRYEAAEETNRSAHLGNLRQGFKTLNGHKVDKKPALSEFELIELSLEAAREKKYFLRTYQDTAKQISATYFSGAKNLKHQDLLQLPQLLPEEQQDRAKEIVAQAEADWENSALENLDKAPLDAEANPQSDDATFQKVVTSVMRSEKGRKLLATYHQAALAERYAQRKFSDAQQKRLKHSLNELFPEHREALDAYKDQVYQKFQEDLFAKLAQPETAPVEKMELDKADGSLLDLASRLLPEDLAAKVKTIELGELMKTLVSGNKQGKLSPDQLAQVGQAIIRVKKASKGLKKNVDAADLIDRYSQLSEQSVDTVLSSLAEQLSKQDLEKLQPSEQLQLLSKRATQAVFASKEPDAWNTETINQILAELVQANQMTASNRRLYVRQMALRYLQRLNVAADLATPLELASIARQKELPPEFIAASLRTFLDIYNRYCHVRLQVGQALPVEVKALQDEAVETPALLGELNQFFAHFGVDLATHLNKQEHTNRLPEDSNISWNRIPTEHDLNAPFECMEQLPEVLKMGQLYLRYCNERVKDPAVRTRLAAEMKLQPGLEDFYFRPATGNDVFRLDVGYPTIYEFDDFPRGLLLTYMLDKFQKGKSGWVDLFRSKLEKPGDTMAFIIHETASGACKYDHQKMAELMGKEEVPAAFTTSDEFHQKFERRGNQLFLDGKRVTVVWHHLMNTPEAPAIIRTLDECGVTILPHFSHVSHKGWQAILQEDAAAGTLPAEFQPLIESHTFPESIRVLSRDQKMTFEGVEYNGLEDLMNKVNKDKLVIKVVGAENAEGVMVCASFSKDKYKNLIKYLGKILDKHAIMIQSNNTHTQGTDLVFNSGTGNYEKFSGNITSRVFMDGNGKVISGLSHLTSGSTGHGMVDMAVYSLKS